MELSSALKIFGLKSLQGLDHIDLKNLYRQLAKQKHPDRTGGGSKEFVDLQDAYLLLRKELTTGKQNDNVQSVSQASKEENHVQNEPFNNTSEVVSQGKANEENIEKNAYSFSKAAEETKSTIETIYTSREEFDRRLSCLSKEEILDKYYEETIRMRTKLEHYHTFKQNQIQILGQIQSKIEELSTDYSSRLQKIQNRIQEKLDVLEKSFFRKLWLKFFIAPVTGKQLWDFYKEEIEVYEKERVDLNHTFNAQLVEIYGETLNSMIKVVDEEVTFSS